jgi:hypothetical protein
MSAIQEACLDFYVELLNMEIESPSMKVHWFVRWQFWASARQGGEAQIRIHPIVSHD